MLQNNTNMLKSLWDAAVNSATMFADFVFGDEHTPGHVRLAELPEEKIDSVVERLLDEGYDDRDVMRHTVRSLLVMAKDGEIRSSYDSMTNLHNRSSIREHIARHIERMGRGLTENGVVIMGDLNRFKIINDTLGHAAGDEAIVTAAKAIANTVRAIDVPARLGGDEFIVFMPDISEDQAQPALQRLRDVFSNLSFNWEGQTVPIRGSFGIAAIQRDQHGNLPTVDKVIDAADHAMYAQKEITHLLQQEQKQQEEQRFSEEASQILGRNAVSENILKAQSLGGAPFIPSKAVAFTPR